MRPFFLAILIAAAWPTAHTQSSLPSCPNDSSAIWTNCVGTHIFDDRTQYVGGWKDNKFFGQGALISGNGYTLAEGVWRHDTVATAGGRWKRAAFSDTTSFFVLMDSIRQEGPFRRAWTLRAFNEPHENFRWLSQRVLERFDCINERSQQVTAHSYSGSFGSGKPLDSLGEANWQYVVPGSVFEYVTKYVCNYPLPKRK
jgi:hypothetical protein